MSNLGSSFGGSPTMCMPVSFDEEYHVFPGAFADKAGLEDGDKILLPTSALDTLTRPNIQYPMTFEITAPSGIKTHCSVLEFTAPEGTVYLPSWMMSNLMLTEGKKLKIRSVNLPKATFVKFQPQSFNFLQISNPRAVLEFKLRSFSCVTVGDHLAFTYNNQKYLMKVKEVQPKDAACIIEADVNVDFDAYKESENKSVVPKKTGFPEVAAAAEEKKPWLLVLGNKGTGKTHYINQTFGVLLPEGLDEDHITRSQLKQKCDHEHFAGFVDTVGLDDATDSNFPTLKELEGEMVVVVFINNDLRKRVSLKAFSNKLGIPQDKIWSVRSFCCTDIVPADLTVQYAIKDPSHLVKRQFSLPKLPKLGRVKSAQQAPKQTVKQTPIKLKQPTPARTWNYFNEDTVRTAFKTSNKGKNKNMKAMFQSLSFEELKLNRRPGDKLLGLILERKQANKSISEDQVSTMKSNSFLKRFFFEHMGDKEGLMLCGKLFSEEYKHQNDVADESVGDIIEAALEKYKSAYLVEELFEHYYMFSNDISS